MHKRRHLGVRNLNQTVSLVPELWCHETLSDEDDEEILYPRTPLKRTLEHNHDRFFREEFELYPEELTNGHGNAGKDDHARVVNIAGFVELGESNDSLLFSYCVEQTVPILCTSSVLERESQAQTFTQLLPSPIQPVVPQGVISSVQNSHHAKRCRVSGQYGLDEIVQLDQRSSPTTLSIANIVSACNIDEQVSIVTKEPSGKILPGLRLPETLKYDDGDALLDGGFKCDDNEAILDGELKYDDGDDLLDGGFKCDDNEAILDGELKYDDGEAILDGELNYDYKAILDGELKYDDGDAVLDGGFKCDDDDDDDGEAIQDSELMYDDGEAVLDAGFKFDDGDGEAIQDSELKYDDDEAVLDAEYELALFCYESELDSQSSGHDDANCDDDIQLVPEIDMVDSDSEADFTAIYSQASNTDTDHSQSSQGRLLQSCHTNTDHVVPNYYLEE